MSILHLSTPHATLICVSRCALPRERLFTRNMRTVSWDSITPAVRIIDQRRLPADLVIIDLHNPQEVTTSIRQMAVRGAPAIGAVAAFGLALAGQLSTA
ncbi:MAG: hypothetical protein V3S81_05965, partial [Anaerolineales bacterium]